ncbi:MAG: Uma2 family endonuclease [Gemmatimonadales bacterium]
MSVLQVPDFWTADMVRALSDDGKCYETVHGELFVSPAPRVWHQIVAERLTDVLKGYLAREPVGMAIGLPADISWGPDVLVEPDVFVAPLAELRTLDWTKVRTLLLVVEVLSPSSLRTDRFAKRRLYQEVGIPLYWIVDADAHVVECWTPDAVTPALERETLVWHPAGAVLPCRISLAELFQPL